MSYSYGSNYMATLDICALLLSWNASFDVLIVANLKS